MMAVFNRLSGTTLRRRRAKYVDRGVDQKKLCLLEVCLWQCVGKKRAERVTFGPTTSGGGGLHIGKKKVKKICSFVRQIQLESYK